MRVQKTFAATIVAASLTCAVPAWAGDQLIHHSIDRSTGAIARVFKTSSGSRVELETPTLKVLREISGTRVVTAIKDGVEQVTVSLDRGVLTVVSPSGRLTASRQQTDRLASAQQVLAASPAVRHALTVLQRLGFGPSTPIRPLLLTTRAFLAAVVGQQMRPGAMREWMAGAPAATPRIVKASDGPQSQSPTDCWNSYAKEAIAAWSEYEDCLSDVKWYEFLEATGCAVIYDMRAIGAFSWWAKCVALA